MKHKEFERLVHAATFHSRGEYKSTSQRLRRNDAQKCPATGHGIFALSLFSIPLLACLSVLSDVHVLSSGALRANPATLFANIHRPSIVRIRRPARRSAKKNAPSRNSPWRIRDERAIIIAATVDFHARRRAIITRTCSKPPGFPPPAFPL